MPSILRLYELAELFGCEAMDLLTQENSHIDDRCVSRDKCWSRCRLRIVNWLCDLFNN